jgi:hypothetical protein
MLVRRDLHKPIPLIDLDIELGEEVFSTEDRDADIAETARKRHFPPGNSCDQGGRSEKVIRQSVAGIYRLFLAVANIESERYRISPRKHRPTRPAVHEHPKWKFGT